MHKKEKTFSLKDQLFSPENIAFLAATIQNVHPAFDAPQFQTLLLSQIPNLELKQVVTAIQQAFTQLLPSDYLTTRQILLDSLQHLPEDRRQGFIYAGHADYIAVHGCTAQHLQASLQALGIITAHFSAEFAIRPFLNTFPQQTIAQMEKWSHSPNPAQRRLASEGLRPKLPWAIGITSDPHLALPILDTLHADLERDITRSVANHLNDLSKTEPDLVVQVLTRWQQAHQQSPQELDYIIHHSLRTSIKRGHPATLAFLGYAPTPAITLTDFTLHTPTVPIGSALQFSFTLKAQQTSPLIIDYKITFATPHSRTSQKVFKLKTLTLPAGESITLTKSHPFKPMTTRALHPGQHTLELQINGRIYATHNFQLTSP
jgi:3-methyladenine DNA glycosylase AlkC